MPETIPETLTDSNAFQSGARKVIPAVLIYARRGTRVLMIEKTEIWNGLGGKCEADESPLQAARREFYEEAGVDLEESRFKPLGVLQFPNFKPARNEDWLVFVFQVDLPDGEVQPSCEEGILHWIESSKLDQLPLWDGDKEFLPWVAQGRSFVGTFWYKNKKLARHWIAPFGA